MRSPRPHHLVLGLLEGHAAGADLAMQPQLIAILHRGLAPGLEPEVSGRRGMPAETERDEVIQLVVLRRARVSVEELALDGVRELPGRAHPSRVAALADCGLDRGLGHVSVHGSRNRGPSFLGASPRCQQQRGGEEDDPNDADSRPGGADLGSVRENCHGRTG